MNNETVSWPKPTQAWYAVGVFALVLTMNFLDRGILNLLVGPIKRDLQLTDFQMSLLIGLAFVCFYLLLGLPIARLVDSRSRRLIIGIGIATWSAATALCGLAQNFGQLFLARVGVGVGEACNGPATFSMLSDLFPREKLARAIGVLNFGFVAGTGIAMIVGAAVIRFVETMPDLELPILGTLRPWQLTFLIVGAPGLLVALLMRTVREPARRGRIVLRSAEETVDGRSVPVREVFRFIGGQRATYMPMFVGLAFTSLLTFGIQSWTPEMFARTYGWSIPKFGFAAGLVTLLVFPLGLVPGGMLAEWLTKKGYDDANLRVTLYALLAYIPPALLFPLMPTAELSLVLLGLSFFCISFAIGPQNAALQVVTPNQMRGQVTALFLFIFNVVGFGFGATFVALFTDFVFGDEAKLRYAITASVAVLGPLAALVLRSGLKPYAASVASSRAWV
jgi:MFS family permease